MCNIFKYKYGCNLKYLFVIDTILITWLKILGLDGSLLNALYFNKDVGISAICNLDTLSKDIYNCLFFHQ